MDTDNQAEILLGQIREAFLGVELGEGVSLNQALVIDCYGSDEEQQEARAKDERHEWQKMISMPLIERALNNALSFFDALGTRFHLPVCLSLVVISPDRNQSLLDCLGAFHYEAHQLLREAQRQCIRDVLLFVIKEVTQQGIPFLRTDLLLYWDAKANEESRRLHHLQKLKDLGVLVTHTPKSRTQLKPLMACRLHLRFAPTHPLPSRHETRQVRRSLPHCPPRQNGVGRCWQRLTGIWKSPLINLIMVYGLLCLR